MNTKRSKIEELKTLLSWNDDDVEQFVEELKELMGEQQLAPKMNVNQKIHLLLTRYGFVSNLNGYLYLKDAIAYCVEHGKVKMMSVLYPEIVKKYPGTTVSGVEREIRFSIERAFDDASPELLKILGYSNSSANGKLTNSAFIFFVSNYIREGLL